MKICLDIRMRTTLLENGINMHSVSHRGTCGCDVVTFDENEKPVVTRVRLDARIATLDISQDEVDVLLIYRAVKQMKAN